MSRWKKGQSGNPAGRKKGTRQRISVQAEHMMAENCEPVVRAVLDAARGGDMAAAKLVLERIVPLRRGRPVTFPLPPIESPADLPVAMAALSAAVCSGELTPDEGQAVAAVLEQHRRAFELTEIEKRLARVEAAVGDGD